MCGRLVVAHARYGHLDTEPVRCLHCQGKGHMSCAHVFEVRNCDAYSSTCTKAFVLCELSHVLSFFFDVSVPTNLLK